MKIVGTQGAVKIATTAIAEVTEFSLEETGEVVEDSVLGTTAKTFQPDRTAWQGSLTMMYDKDAASQAAIVINAALALHLIPAGDSTGNEDFNGNVLITGISMPTAAGAMVTQAITFQGTGALTVSAI